MTTVDSHSSSEENDLYALKMKILMADQTEKTRQKFLKEIPTLLANIEKIGYLFIDNASYYHSTIKLLELNKNSIQKNVISNIFSKVPTYIVDSKEINHTLRLQWNENDRYFKFTLENDFFSVSIWNHFISFSCKGYEIEVDTTSDQSLFLLESSVVSALKAYYPDFANLNDLASVRSILPFLLI